MADKTKHSRKKIWQVAIILVILLTGILMAIPIAIKLLAKPLIQANDTLEPDGVAIVFGAGLTRSGRPSPILRDRIETAVDLFNSGKASILLMSGDNRFLDYNEPGAMADYAMSLGVPESRIVLDYAGRRTYDTCYRAIHIFGVKSAILVTQSYHLPRALYTCSKIGLNVTGASADKRDYNPRTMAFWSLREIPAQWLAFWQVNMSHPLPVLGEPEPITLP